ncbi:MAG: copper chaperone PCu(A)C [bacterium]|nr:copper chaperone PCu(A)C [Gammaproteobacteria bacterium]HIL95806.1 copper chaperone PCu(A)C [Pseudomonadales bacterium]
MKTFFRVCLRLATVSLFSLTVSADATGPGLVISDAWARATPPGAPMGAVYLQIANPTIRPIQVTEITTAVAKISEIHESIERDGMSRMREVDPFIVESGATVSLVPGGKHIMLMRLHEPLIQGGKFLLVFSGNDGYRSEVEVIVGSFGQMEMPQD